MALIILLCGCEKDNYVANNPLSENEIIKLIKDEVYKKTAEEVDVKIINKENYEICTMWLDNCFGRKKIEGIYSYDIEITQKNNNDIVGSGYYVDGYINGDNIIKPKYSIDDYLEQVNSYPAKKELRSLLDNGFTNYSLINSLYEEDDYDIFVYSPNYDKTRELIDNIDIINENYKKLGMNINVFILKDINAYNSLNFNVRSAKKEQQLGEERIELYTKKRATKFDGEIHELEYDYFINDNSKSFDYVILWYHGYPYYESNGFFEKYGLK